MDITPNFTGIAPPQAFSTGGQHWSQPNVMPAPASKKELIEIWYIEPLRRMDGHQAFVCVSVCLFLYEKYLRKTGQIALRGTFNSTHKVFNQIGKDLGISSGDAFEFWTCWRNGLAHAGMPKVSKKYEWGMTGEQKEIVSIQGKTFTLNPWLLRDKILNKVENKKEIWNDELTPLMKVFRVCDP